MGTNGADMKPEELTFASGSVVGATMNAANAVGLGASGVGHGQAAQNVSRPNVPGKDNSPRSR